MLNCKVGSGKYFTRADGRRAIDFAVGARAMAKHRLKCRNSQCKYEGMMDATSDRPFAKKTFLMQSNSKKNATGVTPSPAVTQMQIRCPKCGGRWRMRADQLH